MTSRSLAELNLVRTCTPLATVEIDIDSLPADAFGYADLVHSALTPFAAAHPEMRATVYVNQRQSINFGVPAYCAFFGVAGNQGALRALYECFGRTKGVRFRYSDEISESEALQQYQIEDGKLWYPDDGYTWRTDDGNDSEDERCNYEDGADGDPGDDDGEHTEEPREVSEVLGEINQRRTEMPARFRAARSDASVGSISRKIEAVFGLPEGSVALRAPDRKVLRSDATIRTLRRRWE